ncbi:Fc.00g070790.m01.CDS01 [Cosmosporella sp. VM-42]
MARLATVYNVLLGLEFGVATTALVLFGLAYPDRFRSQLWENGGEEGLNSNPNKRIYFYANHKEPPEIPLIWSQRLTDSNFAIAILSFIIVAARFVMSRVSYLPRYASIMYDVLLASFWSISLVGQSSGDFSDPDHASEHPWYLTQGCTSSWDRNRGYCRVAQASFVVSMLAVALYGGKVLFQLLELVCNRGKEHAERWSYDHRAGEEKHSDLEREAERWLTVREPHVDEALSPVLAFFPSEYARL